MTKENKIDENTLFPIREENETLNKKKAITILSAKPVDKEMIKGMIDKKETLSNKEKVLEYNATICFLKKDVKEKIQEFIDELDKKINDARMYADIDEDDFWATSTISPQDAESRARYLEEFGEEIHKLAKQKFGGLLK